MAHRAPFVPVAEPIGQAWLRDRLALPVPPPAYATVVGRPSGVTESDGERVVVRVARSAAPPDDPIAHLEFALCHEAIDLTVIVAALRAIPVRDLTAWVAREKTGAFARRAWFLAETLAQVRLDHPDALSGNYVPALDPRTHVTAPGRRSKRHRVVDTCSATRDSVRPSA